MPTPIVFWCQTCGHGLTADPKLEGLTKDCPKCGTVCLIEHNTKPRLRTAVPRPKPPSALKSISMSLLIVAVYGLACWFLTAANTDHTYDYLTWWGLAFWVSLGIGTAKKRALFGAALGLFTGPVGLLVIALTPPVGSR